MKIYLFSLLFLVFSNPTFSNGGPVAWSDFEGTKDIKLINNASIDLTKEVLDFYLYSSHQTKQSVAYAINDYVDIVVTYTLKNTNKKAENVTFGFPIDFNISLLDSKAKVIDQIPTSLFDNNVFFFSITDADKKLEVKTRNEFFFNNQPSTTYQEENIDPEKPYLIPIRKWFISNLNFTPLEKKIIKIKYRITPSYSDKAYSKSRLRSYSKRTFKYDFSPAAEWKGRTIEDFTLNIHYDSSKYHIPTLFWTIPVPLQEKSKYLTLDPNSSTKTSYALSNLDPKQLGMMTFSYQLNATEALIRGIIRELKYEGMGNTDNWRNNNEKYLITYSWSKKRYIKVPININASSQLTHYPASNLIDNDFSTAWVEDMPSQGIGEKIRIQLGTPVKLSQIILINGYQKSLKTYIENSVVKKIKVTKSCGCFHTFNFPRENKRIQLYEHLNIKPENAYVYSKIPLILEPNNLIWASGDVYNSDHKKNHSKNTEFFTNEALDWIELEILEVYPGTKYQDTAITEVVLIPFKI